MPVLRLQNYSKGETAVQEACRCEVMSMPDVDDMVEGLRHMDLYETEIQLFNRMVDKGLLDDYRGKYVAISGGKVIDSSNSLFFMRRHLDRTDIYFGKVPRK